MEQAWARFAGGWRKPDLVAAVRIGLDAGRLKIVPGLALAPTLVKELGNFKVKTTPSANEVFSAREGDHDDLVLALALAVSGWPTTAPSTRGDR